MPHGSQTRKLGWNLFRGASGMGRRHRGTSTPQDLLLPEGKLIRTTRGGPNALKQLLLDLKKYSFSGYVRTVRVAAGNGPRASSSFAAGTPRQACTTGTAPRTAGGVRWRKRGRTRTTSSDTG